MVEAKKMVMERMWKRKEEIKGRRKVSVKDIIMVSLKRTRIRRRWAAKER